MKFVILSTRQKYGGAIVLHSLCKSLNDLGFEAKVFYYHEINIYKQSIIHRVYYWLRWIIMSCYDSAMSILSKIDKRHLSCYQEYRYVPVKNVSRKYFPFIDNDTIVVYPDTIYGNPLHSQKVVRWLLYYNRYGTDDKAYGKNDLFIAYSMDFNDKRLNPNEYIITTPFIDLNFYKQTNFGERHGNCYIIRKGKQRTDIPSKLDGIIIDDLPEDEKVKVFNTVENCISYDTKTAYSSLAALCGCRSIVVPEPGHIANDYRKEDNMLYGIAIGFSAEEREYAETTLGNLRDLYNGLNKRAIEDTEKFIHLCEKYFLNDP